jgi:signal transduction histidine kinase
MKNLIEVFFKILDFFLPSSLKQKVSTPYFFKARIITAVNLSLFLFTGLVFILSFTYLQAPSEAKVSIGLSFVFLFFNIIFLKFIRGRFETIFRIVSAIQVILVSAMIYRGNFANSGMGVFGLIGLFPMGLVIAFYFKRLYSFIFFFIYYFVLIIIIKLNYDQFYVPVSNEPNFKLVYTLLFILNFGLIFLISTLFSYLNEELQKQLDNHKELLIEGAKFNSLGQMASTLAHDINNPLFSLQSKIHKIRENILNKEIDEKATIELLDLSESTIIKMAQMIQGISTYAREGHGESQEALEVNQILDDIVMISKERIENNKIRLTLEYGVETDIICHPTYLARIFLNLINNAIDALDNISPKEIRIKTEKKGSIVQVSIIDSGLGISKSAEDNLFSPFYTTKKVNKGTGLGLSISRGLVELHNGKIYYLRKNDETHFIVELPSLESQIIDQNNPA